MDVDQLFEQVEELETSCQYDQVIVLMQQIIDAQPDNVQAWLTGASSYVSKNTEESDVQNAIQWYTKAIELEPDQGYEKFFAVAQLVQGHVAISYYEQGIKILDSEITRCNNKDQKEALKTDRIEGLRSLVEVLVFDMPDVAYLMKAKELVHKLIKETKPDASAFDVFLLAQIYDRCGKKFKSQVRMLCEAIARRVLAEEVDNQSDDKTSDYICRFASFCMDYKFMSLAKLVIDRLGLIGGKTTEYLSMKSLWYRQQSDRMLKKCHFYADTCTELMEELEGDDDAERPDGLEDIKQTVDEIKEKTPKKLEPLFQPSKNGSSSNREDVDDNDDDEEVDSAAESDDENEDFPVVHKPIAAKRYKSMWESEVKAILDLCRKDITFSADVQAMETC